jgi:hypothetical protein
VVVALVEQLLLSGEVESQEEAFGELEKLGIMSFDSAQRLFYQARREERFRAILLASPELARMVTAEELVERVQRAETLESDKPITRTVENSQLGSVDITLKVE